MTKPQDDKALVAGEDAGGGGGGGGVSLGKGAWDCDTNTEIPPEKEAYVFEEIATMDFPFEGIPTVPPRKDMDHLAFFCEGCRYRVTAYPDWTAAQVKQALFKGGIARANKPPHIRNTPGIQARRGSGMTARGRASHAPSKWEDLELIYAGQRMEDDKKLANYFVPPVRGRDARARRTAGRRAQTA
eukprot:scaffold1.g5694.t1